MTAHRIRRSLIDDHPHITLWLAACATLVAFGTLAVALFG